MIIIVASSSFCFQRCAVAEGARASLVCSGSYTTYKPEMSKATISPSSATIDFTESRFLTPIGEFGIKEKDENVLWIVANQKTLMQKNEHLSGTIDRISGEVFIAWLDQASSSKMDLNRRADFTCKPAKKMF